MMWTKIKHSTTPQPVHGHTITMMTQYPPTIAEVGGLTSGGGKHVSSPVVMGYLQSHVQALQVNERGERGRRRGGEG